MLKVSEINFLKKFSRYTEGDFSTRKPLEIEIADTQGQVESKRRRDSSEFTGGKSAKVPRMSQHGQISPARSPVISPARSLMISPARS